jgi:hypothetical protein
MALVLGFLTITGNPQDGLIGGLLALNDRGRPIEFHCTAPLRANRAQQILYGHTLRPYLYGEQIAHALLERCKVTARITFTDEEDVMAVRGITAAPVVLVRPPHHTIGTDRLVSDGSDWLEFNLGQHAVAVSIRFSQDRAEVTSRWAEFDHWSDLHEPFERIREAIKEAQLSPR